MRKMTLYEKFFKRPLDVVCSGLALVILSPVMGITAVIVRIKLGSPVLFVQERPGKDEKIFKLCKFRTMTDQRDESGKLLPDEQRLTEVGRFLRSTSLDELPSLINVFCGDMSLVGPRPLLVRYLPRYNARQHHRHDVRPGLTGYAQVHGRNTVSWEDKFEMDVYYTEHIDLRMDLTIILQTVKTVILREGISSETSATMEEFMGNVRRT